MFCAGLHCGWYGTTPVTLALFPAIAPVGMLLSLQPCFHPNVVASYGVALMAGSSAALVMESVTTSLSRLLDEIGQQLSLRERVDIAIGCVSAVDYLHHHLRVRHGMLTRDFIFCSRSLAAKVLDPMAVALVNGNVPQMCATVEDDIQQLGHILLALFHGVVLGGNCGVSDECGQCCEPHLLRYGLRLMAEEHVSRVLSCEAILSMVEGMRKTDQYKQCPPSRELSLLEV